MDEDGCYSLVNNFTVRSTSVPTERIVSHVARVTPSPQYQLQFQPGDVLGLYVESYGTRTNFDNGVALLNDGSYTDELVWFARINIATQPPQSGSCPYPIGTNGELQTSTHAAPVISLSITTYSCYPSNTNLLHPSPIYIATVESDVNIVNPRNGPSNTSTTSLSALILGITLPVIMLVGVVITSVLIIVVIRRRKSSTNLSHGSNDDQEVQYVYDYFAVNTAESIRMEQNEAYATHSNKESQPIQVKMNEAYATSQSIQVKTNEAYAIHSNEAIKVEPNVAYATYSNI